MATESTEGHGRKGISINSREGDISARSFQISRIQVLFGYCNEGKALEPAHIHVRSGGKEAKVGLIPDVSLARNDGFDARTIRVLLEVVQANQKLLEDAWHDYFA